MNKYKFYERVKRIEKFAFDRYFTPNVEGLENLPVKPYILDGNHISMLDAALLIAEIPDQINFMAKDELFQNKFLNWLFTNMKAFPVKRDKTDLGAMRHACQVLKDEEVLGIFPEGTRNKGNELLEFKKGTEFIAFRSKALVVPFGISGEYGFKSGITLKIGEAIPYLDLKDDPDILREKVKTLVKGE